MSKSGRIALGAARADCVCHCGDRASPKRKRPRNYGIGHVATPEQWPVGISTFGQTGRARLQAAGR